MKIFILANREHIKSDVEGFFNETNPEEIFFKFQAEMQPFLETSKKFAEYIVANTKMGETLRLIIAGPTAIAYIMGLTFAHSSRNIIFSYLDFDTKKYVDIDLSDHKDVHV